MKPTEAYEYLLELPRFATHGDPAMRPGLERVRAILEAMDNPHEEYPVVHVAGTNGKGSTASMIAAIMSAYGLSTGLHTSPHLLDMTERMRVDGVPAPGEWLTEAVGQWKPVFDRLGPSFFEAAVALSFRYFADGNVDRAVVEVGMGGRLDATNVVSPDLSVITHIGLDHTQWLGETLADVAREKAGIIKDGVPVCAGNLPAEAVAVVRETAAERNAPVHVISEETTYEYAASGNRIKLDIQTPDGVYDDLVVGMSGPHQHVNAVLAVRCAELLLPPGKKRSLAVRKGLADVRQLSGIRGRFERVSEEPPIVVDVAHNANSLQAVLQSLAPAGENGGRLIVALGLMGDKDVVAIARHLSSAGALVWPVALDGDRAVPAPELSTQLQRQEIQTIGSGGDIAAAIDWYEAHAQEGDILLATGSHRVVSGVFRTIDRQIRKTN